MKIGVRVMPRKEVLDSQGRAVEGTLRSHDFSLNSCRVGKYVVLELESKEEKTALAEAKKMAEFVLHNPLIETFELEVLKS